MIKGLRKLKNLILAFLLLSFISYVSCSSEISGAVDKIEDTTDNDLNKLFDGGANFLKSMNNFLVRVFNGDKTILDKLDEISDDTCLDELINQKNVNLLDNIITLCKYIEVSDCLKSLNLSDNNDIVLNGNNNLKSLDDINSLIEQYKSDNDNVEVISELKSQEINVNNYICKNGNAYMAEFYDLLIRAKIADSYGFDTDISLGIANSIEIPSEEAMQYNTNNKVDSISVGSNSVKLNADYKGMLENLYLAYDYANSDGYIYDDVKGMVESFIIDGIDYIDDDYNLKIK